jgi:tRNA (cmo5U34)-methyltransferase
MKAKNEAKMNTDMDYDEVIYRACPEYACALRLAARLVPDNARAIVSLGTGTGNLESEILASNHLIRITGYDKNLDYLRIASKKLGSRFQGIATDILQAELSIADAVVSSLTLHHLEDQEKRKVFSRIYSALPSRGVFINYDIVKAPGSTEHDSFVEYVTEHMRKNGLNEEFIEEERLVLNGIGDDADKPMTLEKQCEFLESIGFKFKLEWKNSLFVIYSCAKE